MKNKESGRSYNVPCGACYSCINRFVNDWNVRLKYELSKNNYVCLFCTLTYNDENLPKDGDLSKSDIVGFFKRLRVNLWRKYKVRVKYLLTGEYGSKRGRPHYHMLIFGMDKIMQGKSLALVARSEIENAWRKGFVDVEYLYNHNVSYVLKYVIKDKFKNVGIQNPEKKVLFMSSRRPAIGKLREEDLESLIDKVYTIVDEDDMLLRLGGYRYAIPRYWLKLLPSNVYHSVYSKIALEFADMKYSCILQKDKEIKIDYNSLRLKYKKYMLKNIN